MAIREFKEPRITQKHARFKILTDVMLIFVLPVCCAILEKLLTHAPATWILAGKWFLFWAFGFRLFSSGIKQASDPSYVAKRIYKKGNAESEMVRELGFANICLGIGGILSLINETWGQVIAIIGCMFFGLAGIRHLTGEVITSDQKFALVSDLVIFVIILLYVIYTLK